MQPQEQQLIDGLFSRLKQAETQSAPRDTAAEQHIAQRLQAQPAAPYYMAQTLLIQEAALKRLNEHVLALEADIAQLKNGRTPPSSGSFLAGLFGGGRSTQQPAAAAPVNGSTNAPTTPAAQPGSGFLASALQTATGVAGGVVLGNMLTSLFNHTRPEELLVVDNMPSFPPDSGPVNAVDHYNQTDDSQFLNQDAGLPQDNVNDLPDAGWDDGNSDDDSSWT